VSELTHPEVFKAYDVRGLYGEELDPGTAHAIGRAFARAGIPTVLSIAR